MAVPIDSLINSESSDEDFSDSESFYSSENESMEDEPSSKNINEGSLSSLQRKETEPNSTEEEEYWVKYPYLKCVLSNIVARGLIPEYFAFERAKLIADEKAKELNAKCKAFSIMELEFCSKKWELVASVSSAMKPGT